MYNLALKSNKNGRNQLLKKERSGWHLTLGEGDPATRLNQLADVLRNAGLVGAWRNGQLAVRGELGVQIGTIERGAVRLLGIDTFSVHFVGQSGDGRYWVQQRALNTSINRTIPASGTH